MRVLPSGSLAYPPRVGLRLQDAGGLSAALVIGPLIFLRRPGGGQGIRGASEHRNPLQAVSGGAFVMAHILLREHHGLSGEGMGHRVPDPAGGVFPRLHQIPGYRDQFQHSAGAGIPDDPVIAVAALIPAVFQYLLSDCWGVIASLGRTLSSRSSGCSSRSRSGRRMHSFGSFAMDPARILSSDPPR